MSSDSARPSSLDVVGDLARTLRSLRRELRHTDGRQGRDLEWLVRFTSEVTIPATILVLETNIRALELLQRSLRLARHEDDGAHSRQGSTAGHAVVDRIDDALGRVEAAVEDVSDEDEVGQLLAEARRLNRQLETQLADTDAQNSESASVDVESELASLKEQHEDRDQDDQADGT